MLVPLRRTLKKEARAEQENRLSAALAKVEKRIGPAPFLKSEFLDCAFEPSATERLQVVSSRPVMPRRLISDRSGQTEDGGFMAYVPLVATLLERGQCEFCYDYDGLVWDRKNRREVTDDSPTADLVLSIDALGELEPDQVDACLDEIASIARRLVLLVMRGSNANASSFLRKVSKRLDLVHAQESRDGLLVLACPAGQYAALDAELGLKALARVTAELAPPPAPAPAVAATRIALPKWVEAARRDVGALWLAVRDGRTPWYAKAIAVVVSILAISPIDFTPDSVLHIGYFDDPVILILGTLLALQLVSPMLLAEFRQRAATIEYVRAAKGSLAVCAIWIAALLVTFLHTWRPII